MSGARAARTCAGMVRACLACALVAGCADTGESARPAWAYGSASADPVAAPEATSLPRVAPPYDVRSTAATLAEWPRIVPGVVARAVTSFDRGGGNDDGFGGTYSELYEDDRGEHVIFDAAGPGVLRTLWFTSTVSGDAPLELGDLRFYFDGADAPALTIDADALFAGTTPPLTSPLVEDNRASSGGYASWVPLPFRGRLRITSESRAAFYAAHYEVLPADWDVASWTPGDADEALAAAFAAAGEPSTLPLEAVPLDVSRAGEGVIDVVRFEPDGAPTDAELRAARVRAWFDGATAPQVDAPLAAFFGSGLGAADVRSIAWTMTPTLYESRLPMPFWSSFRLRVSGLAGTLRVHVGPARFTKDEAGYLEARSREERPTTSGEDFVYADVTGAGKLVATVLTVEPASPTQKRWWEGDLRSRADDLATPAIHGTGHEDDHLGGWSNELLSRPFSLPMQGCPRTDILDTNGQVNANATLYRIWPGIPFLRHLRHTTEHGTGDSVAASYGAVTFLYRQPRERLVRTDGFDVADAEATARHAYASGEVDRVIVTSAFTGERADAWTATTHAYHGPVSFRLAVDPDNAGVMLRRRYDQRVKQSARLEVDGAVVTAIHVMEASEARRWAERDTFIPAALTRGKDALDVRIVPRGPFNAASFEAWTVKP